jgi:hypothetical protein
VGKRAAQGKQQALNSTRNRNLLGEKVPSRIYRRDPVADAFRRMKGSERTKLLRKMVKKAIRWYEIRREKREISVLCSRLQLPPKKLPQLFAGKREASEVIEELREMAQLAEQAGLPPQRAGQIFRASRTIEQARALLEDMAGGPRAAAA